MIAAARSSSSGGPAEGCRRLRTVHRRVENVALLAPVQHTSTVRTPSAWYFAIVPAPFDASSSGWACTVRTQSGSVMQRTILSLGGYRFELHLAVTIGVDEYPAEATGQEFAALIGATCDDLIAGQQPYPAARTVAVPTTATNGEHGEAGFDVELEFGECPTVGLAIGADRYLHDDLVGITEREPEDRMDILVLLDEPDHRLRLIADVLGRLRKLEQAAERRRVELTAAARSTQSSSRSFISSRRSSSWRTSAARPGSPSTSAE